MATPPKFTQILNASAQEISSYSTHLYALGVDGTVWRLATVFGGLTGTSHVPQWIATSPAPETSEPADDLEAVLEEVKSWKGVVQDQSKDMERVLRTLLKNPDLVQTFLHSYPGSAHSTEELYKYIFSHPAA